MAVISFVSSPPSPLPFSNMALVAVGLIHTHIKKAKKVLTIKSHLEKIQGSFFSNDFMAGSLYPAKQTLFLLMNLWKKFSTEIYSWSPKTITWKWQPLKSFTVTDWRWLLEKNLKCDKLSPEQKSIRLRVCGRICGSIHEQQLLGIFNLADFQSAFKENWNIFWTLSKRVTTRQAIFLMGEGIWVAVNT